MSKVILVMDNMPESCDKCSLFHNHYSDMCCGGLRNRTIDYPYPKDFRQDWCPLKDLPEREDVNFENTEYDVGYITGWNECIEKILNK